VCADVRSKIKQCHPEVGIICGSGIGALVDRVTDQQVLPYAQIEGFPRCTVKGHEGELVFGLLGGKSVVVMKGRLHFYEGHSLSDIALPIRMMHFLGVKVLLLTNACGGINSEYKAGDMMIIRDHIDFSSVVGQNPLTGPNDERFGTRFPDMRNAYTKELRELAKECAKELGEKIHEGIYFNQVGPVYETQALYNWMCSIGVGVAGMSTTQEAIVAKHLGMKCFALSLITDLAVLADGEESNHEEVLRMANLRTPVVVNLLEKLITKL